MTAKLVYTVQMSLDGYVSDSRGNFDWAAPDEEVHQAVNDVERSAATLLLGRRTYEVLIPWEDPAIAAGQPPCIKDFHEIWIAAAKVVFSRTLESVSTARTRVEREFDTSAVLAMKENSEGDLGIGGPELAAHAFGAGLVDECHVFTVPVSVGGGTAAMPSDFRVDLELLGQRRFRCGTTYAGYRVKR